MTEREREIEEAYQRLDDVAGKLMMKYGVEVVAKMLTILARRYCDIFVAQIERENLATRKPEAHA